MKRIVFALFGIFAINLFAYAEMASSQHILYHDTSRVCSETWCSENPSGGCCTKILKDFAGTINATKNGYKLRGWTTNNVDDVSDNAGALTGIVVSKNGTITGTLNAAVNFYPAWAKECVNQNDCTLTIGDNGSVTYTASCQNPSDSGANMTCVNSDNQPRWVKFELNDVSQVNEQSSPQEFYCQMNPGVSNCYNCFKEQQCTSAPFTQLSTIPRYTNYDYKGHVWDHDGATAPILDKNGALQDTWKQIQTNGPIQIQAQWEPTTITIQYNYANCGSSNSCTHTDTCNAGNTYNLANPKDDCIDVGYSFVNWSVGTRSGVQSMSVTCGENLANITANCNYTPGVENDVTLRGFYQQ